MKTLKLSMCLCAAAIVFSGCTAGTTYGTGTTHEEATFKGLSNIFAMKNEEQAKIKYQQRPELVMPPSKDALPQPVDQSTADEDWPVSPEQRIAEIQANAPTPDWRTGDLPTEYLTDTDKPGISNSSRLQRASRTRAKGSGNFIEAIRRDASGQGEGRVARERREQLAYSSGVKRKFLTEPPVEYRTPSANAEAGDLGISNEELTERQKKAKKDAYNIEKGVLTPGE